MTTFQSETFMQTVSHWLSEYGIYFGYLILLAAIGFFLLMMRAIVRDAHRRSQRHRGIQDRYIRK